MKKLVLIIALFISCCVSAQKWDVRFYEEYSSDVDFSVKFVSTKGLTLTINNSNIILGDVTYNILLSEVFTRSNGDIIVAYSAIDADGYELQLTYSKMGKEEEFTVQYDEYYVTYVLGHRI